MDSQLVKKLDTTPIDIQTADIAQRILNETDVEKVKDLTALFNLNSQKRNVMRILKMTDLLDTVTDQVITRFERTPDNFSNEDLLKFMQVTEKSIESANKSLGQVEQAPAVQYQQNNQVNINIVDGLDRESRQKVTDTVQSILSKIGNGDISSIVEAVRDEGEILTDDTSDDGNTRP
jgi:hypothetical protein